MPACPSEVTTFAVSRSFGFWPRPESLGRVGSSYTSQETHRHCRLDPKAQVADELQELCRSKTHLSAGLTLHTVDFKYTWEHQSAARRPLGGERKGFGAFRKDLLPNDNYRLSLARASFAFFWKAQDQFCLETLGWHLGGPWRLPRCYLHHCKIDIVLLAIDLAT